MMLIRLYKYNSVFFVNSFFFTKFRIFFNNIYKVNFNNVPLSRLIGRCGCFTFLNDEVIRLEDMLYLLNTNRRRRMTDEQKMQG